MAKRRGSEPATRDDPGSRYVELVRRYDLDDPEPHGLEPPSTPELAMDRLREGNVHFATFMKNCRTSIAGRPIVIPCGKTEVGLGEHDPYGRPKQSPFALILGCSDARSPPRSFLGRASTTCSRSGSQAMSSAMNASAA